VDPSTLDAIPEAAREIPIEKASRGVGLSSGVIFVISIVIQLFGYFATYFFAQGIGVNDDGKHLLGLIQFYLLVASSINGIGDLRIGAAYTFFVSRGKSPTESTATYLVLRLLMVSVAGVLLWSLGPELQNAQGPVAATNLQVEMFGVFLLLPLLWTVSTVFTQLTVAQGESIRSQYPLLLESVIRAGLLIYVATHNPTLETITLAYVPGAVISALYCTPKVWSYCTRFLWAEGKSLFRFAWPLMGSLVLTYVAGNAVGLLVFSLSQPAPDVAFALFNAANGYRILALAVPAAVILPLFPSLASLHARGLLGPIRSQTWQALRYTAMAVVPIAMSLVVYRVNLLATMYHGTWSSAAPALAILALSAIPTALVMVMGTALNSIRLQRLELYITSIQVVVLFATAFLLLPPVALLAPYGVDSLEGAAIATLTSSIAAMGVNIYFLEKYLAVRIAVRPILTISLSAALAFFVISRFNILVNVHRIWQLVPGIVLGFTVYFFVLALVGELSKADVRRLGGMLFLPGRFSDIVARLCWRERSPYQDGTHPVAPGAPPEN
jgi:O-antigen/teichoic acid export membrane protein